MLMAFLLVVVVDNEIVSDNRMLFRSIYSCNIYSSAVSDGKWSPNDRRYYRQENITAYCVPKMVPKGTLVFH